MDKLNKYKAILQEELEYHTKGRIANAPELQHYLVINKEETDFLVLLMGWYKRRFRHNVMYHLQLKDQKVHIYCINTDVDIAANLVEAGIPQSDIIIAFRPEYLQEKSDYSAA